MLSTTKSHQRSHEEAPPGLCTFYKISSASAILQLAVVIGYFVIIATLGARPTNVQEYFAALQGNRLEGMLRGDLLNLVMIALYIGLVPGIYLALRRAQPVGSAFSALLILIAVTICFASNSDFSLYHLSTQYAQAATEAQRAQLLAAGEAIIASDMWNSSGAYVTGMFLQGAGVLISVMMLRSDKFNRVTAITGLLANGIDLLQHMLHPFLPSASEIILRVAGPFYLVWFPMLGRDFLKLSKSANIAKLSLGRLKEWQTESL